MKPTAKAIAADLPALKTRHAAIFAPSWTSRALVLATVAFLGGLFLFGFWRLGFSFEKILAGIWQLGTLAWLMIPPNPGSWVLMHPPQVADPAFPRGQRFLTRAPLAAWSQRATFPSSEACEDWKQEELDRTIDRAHVAWGNDAKNDLDVRRAVNARCVPASSVTATPPLMIPDGVTT